MSGIFTGLPRKVHIGAYTFRIHVVRSDHPRLEKRPGRTDLSTQEVYIDRDLVQLAIEIVQHELTHCINWVYGLHDNSREETFTHRHSTGFADLVTRNPKYLVWMIGAVENVRRLAKS